MGNTEQTTERMEALQALMERLVSPDLTLDEAKDLRGRLFALTSGDQEPLASSMPGDGLRNGHRSPECRHYAA